MRIPVSMAGGDPDASARILVEIANATEAVQDGRIFVELINSAAIRATRTTAVRAARYR
jgi:hypothetical protein